MKKKVALIGLGQQAQKYHLPGILNCDKVELVAVCDIDETKVEQISNELNVLGYTDVKKLVQSEMLDFVIIATPHDTHLDIVRIVSEKGVHILKEKPFAKNLSEAIEMNDIIEKNNVNFMLTLQRRFSLTYSRFFDYINRIGKPSHIDIKYNIFTDKPHFEWRGSKEKAGGGCILDMGYHMIDVLIWFFGLPENLYSTYSTVGRGEVNQEVEDSASIIFNYGGGLSGNMDISRISVPKTEYVKVIGQNGVLELLKNKINIYDVKGNITECIVAKNLTDEQYASKQINEFLRILDSSDKIKIDEHINIDPMIFIEGCYQSKINNQLVKLNELMAIGTH